MKRHLSLRTALLLMMISLVGGMGIHQVISADSIYDQLNKFKDILLISEKFYVDEVPTEKLVEGAITGMIRELDPHSVYFPAKSFEKVSEEMSGKFQGVGLQIRPLNDTIIVVEPIGGGPAARLGILSNDRILRVDDSSLVGVSSADAAKRLRGPKGTKVRVEILRSGMQRPLVYEIIRDDIALYSVDASVMMTDEVGYVNVNRFNTQTIHELRSALEKLRNQGMKKLVLDLRGNPGGILQQAVEMADLFLDGGTKEHPRRIVYTKARRPELSEEFFAKTGEPYEDIPLIVLLSNSSASASEIVAGAVQDWDRGLIVGETSFGKGLVQREWPIADGSAFRLTIARYYTPSGRLIQRPYNGKGRKEYVQEAFDRNETEGDNLNHAHDAESDSLRPVYHTNAGRVVYGGGGITPDFIVRHISLNDQTEELLRRDLFYRYITTYMDRVGKALRREYGDGLGKFKDEYEVTDKMLTAFRAFAGKNDLQVSNEAFSQDEEFIRARLKAYVARILWGNDGWSSVMLEVDPQFIRAVSLFPEATKLTAAR
jgi:carboxyl-terminal processing protease